MRRAVRWSAGRAGRLVPRRVPAVGLRALIALAGGLVVFAVLLTASLGG